MGTWSITPNTLASIDNNGRATFQEHTSQVVYTIKYTSDICGTITKQFTVYPCSPVSCDCSTFSSSTSGNRVPSSTGSTEYVVGYYTGATNCSDPITLSHRSGVDFLGNLRASNGTIYATVKAANSGNERSSTYYVRQSNCEDYFTAYQSAGSPTPVCSSSTHRLGSCVTSDGGSNILIGTYDSMEACSGSWTTRGTLPWWISNVSFSNGNIYATLSQNASASERTGTVLTYLSDIGDDYFDVTQCGTGACDCESSRFSVTGANVDASGGNAVLIGNFTSECEPSMSLENYAGDTFIDYSITSYTYDSSTKKGKIYAKVSQNTTSSERMEQPGVLIIGGTDFCKHFAVTQAKGICTPELTVSAAGNCCVNFKVVQPCTDIQEYDIIEWGYSKFNSPIFTNGQAFSSKSATGATGISQCPSITSDGDWYIFWRNRTAHSVSGSQIVNLTGCATPTPYNISLKISEKYFDKGNTFIILGDNPLTPAQIAKQYTGNAIIVGSGGIATIGFKYVNASCDYDSYTFSASYNIPNDTSWTVGSLAVTDKYNVVNIDGNTVTTIGSFTMRDTDFNTCSDTIYNLS